MGKRHLSSRRRRKRIRLGILLSVTVVLLSVAAYSICDRPAPPKKGTIYNPTFELIKTETGFWGTPDFLPVMPIIKMRWKNLSGTTFSDSIRVKVIFQENSVYPDTHGLSPVLCETETTLAPPLRPGESVPVVLTGTHCFKHGVPEKQIDCHIYLAEQFYKTVSIDKKIFLDRDF